MRKGEKSWGGGDKPGPKAPATLGESERRSVEGKKEPKLGGNPSKNKFQCTPPGGG